jgi:hypothetical protein
MVSTKGTDRFFWLTPEAPFEGNYYSAKENFQQNHCNIGDCACFPPWRAHCFIRKALRTRVMETNKPSDYLPSNSTNENTSGRPNVLPFELVQQVEVEILLEELGEIIESEDGIVTP